MLASYAGVPKLLNLGISEIHQSILLLDSFYRAGPWAVTVRNGGAPMNAGRITYPPIIDQYSGDILPFSK